MVTGGLSSLMPAYSAPIQQASARHPRLGDLRKNVATPDPVPATGSRTNRQLAPKRYKGLRHNCASFELITCEDRACALLGEDTLVASGRAQQRMPALVGGRVHVVNRAIASGRLPQTVLPAVRQARMSIVIGTVDNRRQAQYRAFARLMLAEASDLFPNSRRSDT